MPAGTDRLELTSPARTGGSDTGTLPAPTPAGTRRFRLAITAQARGSAPAPSRQSRPVEVAATDSSAPSRQLKRLRARSRNKAI